MHARTQKQRHARTQTRASTRTHALNIRTHARTQASTIARTHARTCTHARTRTHARTHALTHAHTHARPPAPGWRRRGKTRTRGQRLRTRGPRIRGAGPIEIGASARGGCWSGTRRWASTTLVSSACGLARTRRAATTPPPRRPGCAPPRRRRRKARPAERFRTERPLVLWRGARRPYFWLCADNQKCRSFSMLFRQKHRKAFEAQRSGGAEGALLGSQPEGGRPGAVAIQQAQRRRPESESCGGGEPRGGREARAQAGEAERRGQSRRRARRRASAALLRPFGAVADSTRSRVAPLGDTRPPGPALAGPPALPCAPSPRRRGRLATCTAPGRLTQAGRMSARGEKVETLLGNRESDAHLTQSFGLLWADFSCGARNGNVGAAPLER